MQLAAVEDAGLAVGRARHEQLLVLLVPVQAVQVARAPLPRPGLRVRARPGLLRAQARKSERPGAKEIQRENRGTKRERDSVCDSMCGERTRGREQGEERGAATWGKQVVGSLPWRSSQKSRRLSSPTEQNS